VKIVWSRLIILSVFRRFAKVRKLESQKVGNFERAKV